MVGQLLFSRDEQPGSRLYGSEHGVLTWPLAVLQTSPRCNLEHPRRKPPPLSAAQYSYLPGFACSTTLLEAMPRTPQCWPSKILA